MTAAAITLNGYETLNDSKNNFFSGCSYAYFDTASTTAAVAKSGAGRLCGIFVSSVSGSPTIKIWDNTSAATTVLIDTFIPVGPGLYIFPEVAFGTGCFVSLGGTVKCTVFFK